MFGHCSGHGAVLPGGQLLALLVLGEELQLPQHIAQLPALCANRHWRAHTPRMRIGAVGRHRHFTVESGMVAQGVAMRLVCGFAVAATIRGTE
jgi:hypothetical protein